MDVVEASYQMTFPVRDMPEVISRMLDREQNTSINSTNNTSDEGKEKVSQKSVQVLLRLATVKLLMPT